MKDCSVTISPTLVALVSQNVEWQRSMNDILFRLSWWKAFYDACLVIEFVTYNIRVASSEVVKGRLAEVNHHPAESV